MADNEMPEMPESSLEGLLKMVEGLSAFIEAVAGYRAKCEGAGFSPAAAEAMAVELHRHLLDGGFETAKAQPGRKRPGR